MADGASLWRSIQEPFGDSLVRIDPPVAQERPAAPHVLDPGEVDRADEDRLTVHRRLRDDRPEGIGEEGRAPELDPVAAGRLLVPDAVHRRDVTTVRDGVAPLDRTPGVELLGPARRLLL